MSVNKPKLGEGTTPGPWTAEDVAFRPRIEIWDKDCILIASINWVGNLDGEANARLIAKAPLLVEARELLTALINNTVRISDKVNNMLSEHDPTVIKARALLAKLEED